ncbi:MAG: methylamine dehydrogenase (amicyanin) light chain [Gammaproteobacteria bacterium]|nr:methylamine dehydrogenase (amicyanin) light chain [Gammaproteobacteria bacterium]
MNSNWLDAITERLTRDVARRTSRRGFLGAFGAAIVGGAALPVLPVARADAAEGQPAPPEQDPGDPTTCEYWRNCAIDGYLCSCCGGTANTCPPGTEMSPITWIGTCRNPGDGKDYIISYNDCCGKTSCGACFCNRNERDRPIYRAGTANDYNWCLGTKSLAYHCTVTLILGTATKPI